MPCAGRAPDACPRTPESPLPALDPVVYFFLFGLLAGLARAELRLPPAIYDFVSTILLLSIGIKGGMELSRRSTMASTESLAIDLLVVVSMGVALTMLAYGLLRALGRVDRPDAASIAAHYGSVSVATFAVAIAYLTQRGIGYEPHLVLFLVTLEVPGILVGVMLARGLAQQTCWPELLREALLGRGVLLLLGGLAIGWLAGVDGMQPMAPLFVDLFKGVLALFLLEMGLIAAQHLGSFRQRGAFLAGFALAVPVLFGLIGASVGTAVLGLSLGGTVLLGTLAASASYIAAPAAMRSAVPQANPGLSLTCALGLTFPFNIVVGIPLYERMAHWLQRLQ